MTRNEASPGECASDLEQAVENMIGDVNLFLSVADPSDVDEDEHQGAPHDTAADSGEMKGETSSRQEYTGELELMIAEKTARRRGYGKASLLMFMAWIVQNKQIIVPGGELIRFSVKIGIDNSNSMALFTGLGFEQVKYSEYFRESELELPVTTETLQKLIKHMRPEDRSWSEKVLVIV